MDSENPNLNHYCNIDKPPFITCAGLDCINRPKDTLLIKIINKKGKFCNSCSSHLLKAGLAEKLAQLTAEDGIN
jgi:hypothetical protein